MSKPTWVFVAGAYRTASTTQYQMARDIVEQTENGIGIGYHTERKLKEFDEKESDLVVCKVAHDHDRVYFYMKTAESLTGPEDDCWMNLLLRLTKRQGDNWEGYHFRVNRVVRGNSGSLEVFQDGEWRKRGEVLLVAAGDELELAVSREQLGAAGESLEIEFKWIDNMPEPLNILDFMDHGDTAPNNRFRYVFRGSAVGRK